MDIEKEVKRARRGNRQAFGRLIKEYENMLYRISFSILSSDHDCADAIQEAILKAFDGIGRLREPKYFKTWLTRIVMNESYQVIRRKQKVVPLERMVESGEEDKAYANLELEEVVEQLPEDLRLVIILFYFEDLPLKEMAKVLECPLGTVKTRLFRARTELEKLLRQDEGGKES